MTEGVSTTRIEDHGDEVLVTVTDYRDLVRVLDSNVVFKRRGSRTDALTEADAKTFQSLYTTIDYSEQTVRVATARVFDTDTHELQPSPENLAYYETDIVQRDPTDEEREGYVDSFHDAPSPIYEITLPPMSEFRNPQDAESLTAPLPRQERERLITTLQPKVEQAKWLETKLSYTGYPTNLPPEWSPDEEQKTRGELREGARQRYYTMKEAWTDVFGVQYIEFYSARQEVLGASEPKLELREIPALELMPGSENESYCQYCGGIDSASELLIVPDKVGREKRVCEHCAEQWTDFTEQAVNKAKDERAKENGGQRILHDEYEN